MAAPGLSPALDLLGGPDESHLHRTHPVLRCRLHRYRARASPRSLRRRGPGPLLPGRRQRPGPDPGGRGQGRLPSLPADRVLPPGRAGARRGRRSVGRAVREGAPLPQAPRRPQPRCLIRSGGCLIRPHRPLHHGGRDGR
ncbi:hypothetical protein SGPA1_70062 [Streptomyces misionensis JCM 4497]